MDDIEKVGSTAVLIIRTLREGNDLKMLLHIIFLLGLVQACDSNLKVNVGNLATSPGVTTGENLDGFRSTFTPTIEIADDDYESVLWTQKSGPGMVFFDDPTSPTPNIFADLPGDYILTVTVTNRRGMSTTAEYKFTWYNSAPGAFDITGPLNTVANLKPAISWTEGTDFNSVSYTLTIFESDCKTINQQKAGLTGYVYNLEQDLVDGKSYCVSVIAIDSLSMSTKASNDKEIIFAVDTTGAVTLTGTLNFANEAVDAYIKFGEEASTNPVASISGNYNAVSYTVLQDETHRRAVIVRKPTIKLTFH